MAGKNPLGGLLPMTEDFTVDQPDTAPDDTDEKRKKSISKSKQWKEFVAYGRGRQDAYRKFLPGANPAITKSDDNWRVADCIISEMENWINFIEGILL